MNLIRKLKISKLTNQLLEGVDKEIVDFIINTFNNLIPFTSEMIPRSLFYMNKDNGKWILEYLTKVDVLYVRCDDFAEILEEKYLLSYKDIQDIIQYLGEEKFKHKISKTRIIPELSEWKIEILFKNSNHEFA